MERETLRQYRKEKGWNQSQLAQLLGVTQTLISKWETGAESIPNDVEARLAQAASQAPAATPTATWHRQDGSPIDAAPADEIVHNTAGGQLPAAIARELQASHAQERAPNYAQAQRDIEAAHAVRLKPAPIPYEAWRAASGVLNLPSRRG
jgi:transcriptional regulator with XRE-family HTH domain